MVRFLRSTGNMILDRSPEGLIGALLIALVLALMVSGLYALLHRRVSDNTVLLTCLVLAANVVGMTIAGGYIYSTRSRRDRSGGGQPQLDGAYGPRPAF